MIVYRTQASTGTSWVSQWATCRGDARRDARMLADAGYTDAHVDRIELGTSREAIVEALNHANANRCNWPGETVE